MNKPKKCYFCNKHFKRHRLKAHSIELSPNASVSLIVPYSFMESNRRFSTHA